MLLCPRLTWSAFFLSSPPRLIPVPQDEPFHVAQAQTYCTGDYWTWDPKITTPPGLFVSAYGRFLLILTMVKQICFELSVEASLPFSVQYRGAQIYRASFSADAANCLNSLIVFL